MVVQEEERKEELAPSESASSREPLFGALLFGSLLLVLFGILAVVGWGGYRGWRLNQEQASLASIRDLSLEEASSMEESSPSEIVAPQTELATSQSDENVSLQTKAKGTEIKVLNGGAAKGSAGTLAEALKKEGYSKVTTGNTVADYTGVVVYFSSGLDQEAGLVKASLTPSFPKAETKEALKNNKETAQAPLTIILGK